MSTLSTLMVKLGLDSTDFDRGMANLSNTTKSKLNNLGKGLTAVGGTITGAVTTPVALLGKTALDMSVDFETGMNVLQATTGASTGQMEQLRQKAIDLGADLSLPATSAADAGEAMLELAKSGLSVNDILGASKGVLQLSAAGQLSNADAAMIASNALNMFGLTGDQASRVADLLAAGANASSSSVGDMALSMQMAGSVFASAGVPIDDLVAMIGEMANAGIKGSDAGTSLKTMLMKLQAPGKEAAQLMADLGINIYDANGKMLPFTSIVDQFSSKLGPLTQEQRDQALATVFGSDAIRAANVVLMSGSDAFDTMRTSVTRQGAAADLAASRMKGLGGAWQGLKSQGETLLLTVMQPMMPTLTKITNLAGQLLGKIGSLPTPLLVVAAVLSTIAAVSGPVLLFIGGMTMMMPALATGISAVGAALMTVGPYLLAVAAAAAVAYVAWKYHDQILAGLKVAYSALKDVFWTVVGALQTAWNAIKGVFWTVVNAIIGFLRDNWGLIVSIIGGPLGAVLVQVIKHWDDIKAAFTAAWSAIEGFFRAAWEVFKAIFVNTFEVIAGLALIVWEHIKAPIYAAWNAIHSWFVAAFETFKGIFWACWDAIRTAAEAAWGLIKGAVTAVWQQLHDWFAGPIETFKGIFSTAWTAIQTAATTGWNGIKTAVTTVWNQLHDWFAGPIETFKGIFSTAWSSIETGAGAAWERINNVITTAFGGVKDGVRGVLNGLIRLVNNMIGGLNTMIDVLNKVKIGKDIPHIPTIAELAQGGIVTKPTLALIGEAGPEAVVPLSQGRAAVGHTFYITINASSEPSGRAAARGFVRELSRLGLESAVLARGGAM